MNEFLYWIEIFLNNTTQSVFYNTYISKPWWTSPDILIQYTYHDEDIGGESSLIVVCYWLIS